MALGEAARGADAPSCSGRAAQQPQARGGGGAVSGCAGGEAQRGAGAGPAARAGVAGRRSARWGAAAARAVRKLDLVLWVLAACWVARVQSHKLPANSVADEAADIDWTYEMYLNESTKDLITQTAGKCEFMEQAFEEEFATEEMNWTRWKTSSLHGLFHCGKGSKLFCTMALQQNFLLGVPLPFYPGGGSGAILTLSQNPCTNTSNVNYTMCCRREHCANWTGAHASSNGCILYGTLEAEMAIHIPDDNPALFDWGTFVNGGSPDPTWNEIDQIFRIGPNGSEYHTTYFTPGEHKTVFNPYSVPEFNGYIAGSFHNYTIEWTPEYLAWMIDRETYRNITVRSSTNRPPWRPMSYRLIFRTENSSYPGPSQDAHVYIRRITYTPMPPPKPPNFLQKAARFLYGPYYIVRVLLWAACWVAGCSYLRGGVHVLFG